MRLLFAGGYDTQNLGDYASIKGLKKVLGERGIATDFTVLSRHPDDGFAQEIGVRTVANLDHESKAASKGRIFRGFNEGDSAEPLHRIYKELEASDALVLGNGRLFIDIALGFYSGPMPYFALLVTLARFMGKPVIVYSMSLVEPKTKAGREHLRFLLSNSDLVTVREEASRRVAARYLDDMSKVVVLPDIAFALDRTDGDVDSPLPSSLIGPELSPVAMNFRSVSYDQTESGAYYRETADRVQAWLDAHPERGVVMVPQATYDIDTQDTDDRAANRRVWEHLSGEHQARVHVVSERLTLDQMLSLYRSVGGLYSSRRHGFILSLTQGTSARLFCREDNTEYLRESLPHDELYLEESEMPADPLHALSPEVLASVDLLRKQTGRYATCFAELLESE